MTGNTCWSIPPQQCEHNRILSKAILSLPGRIFLQIQVPHRPRKFMRVFEGDEEGWGPRESAYRLHVIYFPKFENYTAFNSPSFPPSPPLSRSPVYYPRVLFMSQ